MEVKTEEPLEALLCEVRDKLAQYRSKDAAKYSMYPTLYKWEIASLAAWTEAEQMILEQMRKASESLPIQGRYKPGQWMRSEQE